LHTASGITGVEFWHWATPGEWRNGTPPIDNGNTVMNSAALDKLPEFPAGIAKFIHVGRNFESPEIFSDKNIRIYVSFVVEKMEV
jgi:protein TonB